MKSKRKDYITLLSVISAIAVVFLHTNGCFWSFSKSRYWFTANIIECVFYFAVPIFFMITGTNLINYQEKYTTKEYFKKRIKKVLIPFFAWSIIALLYFLFHRYISLENLNFKYIFNSILNSGLVPVYWFFPPLLCIYLCLPLFASVKDEKKDKLFLFYIIVYLIFNVLIPFVNNIFKFGINVPISVFVFGDYFFFVLTGYLLDKHELKTKYRAIIYVCAVAGLLAHIIGTYVLSMNALSIVKTFKGYNNLPCILYSVGIFVLVKQISKKIKNYRIVNFIGSYTFPIYLMHWFIMDMICTIFKFNTTSIIYRLGIPFIIIPICIGLTFIIRKIPIIKKIVP